MTMKIYVAGASKEVQTSIKYITKLKEAGFEITHDWTVEVTENINKGGSDKTLTREERKKYATWDIKGVIAADILWVILPENSVGNGYWVELGAGIAVNVTKAKIIVISGEFNKSIFCELAHYYGPNHDNALEFILGCKDGVFFVDENMDLYRRI